MLSHENLSAARQDLLRVLATFDETPPRGRTIRAGPAYLAWVRAPARDADDLDTYRLLTWAPGEWERHEVLSARGREDAARRLLAAPSLSTTG